MGLSTRGLDSSEEIARDLRVLNESALDAVLLDGTSLPLHMLGLPRMIRSRLESGHAVALLHEERADASPTFVSRVPACFSATSTAQKGAHRRGSKSHSERKSSQALGETDGIAHTGLDLAVSLRLGRLPSGYLGRAYQMIDDAIGDLWRIVVVVEASLR